MKEITFETAREMGLLKDDALYFAYRSVEGCSILSEATHKYFEMAYRSRKKELYQKYQYVNYEGELLKVI
jgi:hypothetical protein